MHKLTMMHIFARHLLTFVNVNNNVHTTVHELMLTYLWILIT